MRHPRLWRDIALAAAAAGAAAAVAALRLPGLGQGALQATLFIGGASLALIGGVGALMAWASARTESALKRGDGVMGRWRVEAAVWPDFLALEAKMAAAPEALGNEFSLPRGARDRDLEVIVGQEGVMIGDSVHRLPRHGLPELTMAGLRMEPGTPVCIELHLYYPGHVAGDSSSSPPRRSVLRFPVSPAAEREAAQFVTWCHAGRPGEADFFHGRGDGSDGEDLSTCRSCGWQTHKFVSVCERCGGSLLSKRWARRFGSVLFVLGVLLSGGMAFLLLQIGPMLLHPGASYGGTRFGGTAIQGLLVLLLLGGVAAFGVTTMVYGLLQMSTGLRTLRGAAGDARTRG
ncbi:MAG: hypothetical protein K8R60_02805 [Burkholderiales bacterium]|nr:hypothetical protein [Burkholderiales bacterium]